MEARKKGKHDSFEKREEGNMILLEEGNMIILKKGKKEN